MYESGLTGTDALAIRASEVNRDNDDMFDGGGLMAILVLFFLFMFMNNGMWGGNGNWGRGNCATQQDVAQGFNFSQLDNGIRGLERGICDLGYAGLQQANQTQAQIAQLGYQTQSCCCETNRNIDAVRAENYRNTCEITTAIHDEGEKTRGLITANVIQELRDQNTAYQLQLSNQAQNATLINALRPFPQPAYITCSPYESAYNNHAYGYGYGGGCRNCGQYNG